MLLSKYISNYINNKSSIESIINMYNEKTIFRFNDNIKYKVFLRYLPHNILNNICSKLSLYDIIHLLNEQLDLYRYEEIIDRFKILNTPISEDSIKNELCYIFRDKILKYYSYLINK